ncbi:facilitated trehalose transporter Tret1-like [Bacillus rossius redtenbacheri]|uniref:facilitated trehalose transporter Tret1-like n=1 Tax=Bacillus rossius redtenbacheri TaxID=93214 RepID=UPI002FDD1611
MVTVNMDETAQPAKVAQKSLKWPQYVSSLIGALPVFSAGTIEGWTSPGVAHLQRPPDGISPEDASVVVSLATLGSLLVALPAGYLADAVGRKRVLLLMVLPHVLAWVIIIFANTDVLLLCLARFISGVAYGGSQVVVPLYNEEISDVGIRGKLGCFFDFMMSAGILYCYFISLVLDYFWMTAACAVVPLVFFVFFVWFPESPVFLLQKGREDEARESLRFFRGAKHLTSYDEAPEIQSIKNYIASESKSSSEHTWRTSLKLVWECLFSGGRASTLAKAMRITICFGTLVPLTGINPMLFYSVEIFQRGRSTISADVCNLITGVLKIICSLITIFLVDRVGRRLLLFVSAGGMILSMLALSLHFLLLNYNEYISHFGWMPCAAVTAFVSSYSLGFGPLPWLILAEIIPTGVKELMGVGFGINYILHFVITMVFIELLGTVGEVATFSFFCVMSVIAILFVKYFVPETKNKAREVIHSNL